MVVQKIETRSFVYACLIFFLIGVGIIVNTYKISYTSAFPWPLYWVGFIICAMSVFIAISQENASAKIICAMLFLYGLVFYIIQYFGSGGYYDFRDEYLFDNLTRVIYSNESLNVADKLAINKIFLCFPGFSILIVLLQKITSVVISYPVVATIIALSHSMVLVITFLMVRNISNTQIAALASFIYSTNIDYAWFNTIFHYESIGLLMFFLGINLFISRSLSKRTDKSAFVFLFIIIITSLTITHHLSSYAIISILTIFVVMQFALTAKKHVIEKNEGISYNSLTVVVVITLSWIIYSASYTIGYFNYNIQSAVMQILNFSFVDSVKDNISGIPSWGVGLPQWELFLYKYTYIPALVLMFLIGLYHIKKELLIDKSYKQYKYGLIIIGFIAFGSIAISATGLSKATEITRRILPFYFIGTAFVIAHAFNFYNEKKRFKQIAILTLMILIVFGGTGIGTVRVRGVEGGNPKYLYTDVIVNKDMAAAGQWLKNNGDPTNTATDKITADMLNIGKENIKSASSLFLSPTIIPTDHNYILVNDKILRKNWEPSKLVVFDAKGTKYIAGDQVIKKSMLDKFKDDRTISLSYDNGCQAVYSKQ